MLAHLSTYNNYIDFISSHIFFCEIPSLYSLDNEKYFKPFFKMVHLRVDDIIPILTGLYSHTGRPAKNQIEILRSFILMAHFNETRIKKWVQSLHDDPLIAILCGFEPNNIPAASNHYDFINRIFGNFFHHNIYPPSRYHKPNTKQKPKKGEKLNNLDKFTTDDVVNFYLDGNDDNDRPELLLQQLFDILAVHFSVDNGLIENPSSIIASGDGSSLHIHSNPFGRKICNCSNHRCVCDRRYSDPEADIGWDSDLGEYYFGYTEYNISYYNKNLSIDLPLFLTLEKASQHDAITSVSALHSFLSLNQSVAISKYCLDSASDNYATHRFLSHHSIIPFIDINKRCHSNVYDKIDRISENGKPICAAGIEMIYWGFESKKYRHKYRCPLALKRIKKCDHCNDCRKSNYGLTVYIKSSTDPKLFGPIPFGSNKWKKIYKNRTSCERINNRILNNYNLHQCRMHTRPRLLFLMMMIGINIHLDAFFKVSSRISF